MSVSTCSAVQGKRVLIVYGGFLKRGGGVVTHIRNVKQLLELMGAQVGTFTMEDVPKAIAYSLVLMERLFNWLAAPLGYLVRYRLTRLLFEKLRPEGYDYYIYEDIYTAPRNHEGVTFLVFVHALRSFQLHGLRTNHYFLLNLEEWERQLVDQLRTHIITVSDEFRERLRTRMGLNVDVLYNFTLINPLHLPRAERKSIILFVGALITGKNPTFAIRVARALKQKGLDFSLIFVGEGPLRKVAEFLAAQFGLTENVVFMGNASHEQVLQMMSYSKAVVIPSLEETFSYVALEAKVLGCAVFATRGLDIPRELVDRALPISPGSEEAWATEIERLLTGTVEHQVDQLPEKFMPCTAATKLCKLLASL